MNPLKQLHEHGQSVWLDYIRRTLISSGDLQHMIEEDGVRGVTSNPAIFEKAITGSDDYREQLAELKPRNLSPMAVYEEVAIRDIQEAADAFRGLYDSTAGGDGYVSLEVSPYLANQTEPTIKEARRLWKAVDRPNVMIKVPGTPAGIPAIEQLISEGININTTLLFSVDAYEKVAESYVRGLERLAASGGNLSRVAGVASFFVSRVDGLADKQIQDRIAETSDEAGRERLSALLGKVAIANAKIAYQAYKKTFSGPRWEELAGKGAKTQRVLWASTSVKNPAYPDLLYVNTLIGADTVATLPPATLDAFRDHGTPADTLDDGIDEAKATLAAFAAEGFSLDKITDELLADGVRKFAAAFDDLLKAVDSRCKVPKPCCMDRQSMSLPADLETAVRQQVEKWRVGRVRRLWSRDASLWTGNDEGNWLGWLDIVDAQLEDLESFRSLAAEIRSSGFEYLVLLGMGGSSLCPEVFSMTYGKADSFPELKVLDSTDPAQVRAIEQSIDIEKAIFIVASKSGSTLEPNVMKDYFHTRVQERVGEAEAGKRFIAITDPGSKLEQIAKDEQFRWLIHGVPSIGGRFSALSNFGMAPAALSGMDVAEFLHRTQEMVVACSSCPPIERNPGAMLGLVLGTLANLGRDKLTLVCSPRIHDFGAWLEQLLAESTGKDGKAIIPVDREPLGPPALYGNDRVFAYLRLGVEPDAGQDEAIEALEQAGQPVVRITLRDTYDIGQEMFRWEIATAVAGSVMGVNPFNQPDVEASKVATRTLTDEYEKAGAFPAEEPLFAAGGIQLFTDETNAVALNGAAGDPSLAGILKAHLERLGEGDYCALLAYIEMNDAHEAALQRTRKRVRDARNVATCLGFGPRFLHSTGQAYKGGPNSGVFLQVTSDPAADLPIPGRKSTFGAVITAQARGDFKVLAERGRRVLRVHLSGDVAAGLATLDAAVAEALS